MMRVAVIDDIKTEVRKMLTLLKEADTANSMALFGFLDVESYKRAVEDGSRFDVLFIDITLGNGTSGIAEANELLRLTPGLILVFVSAYESYFKEVYKVPHAYFLTKPIDGTYLRDCLYRIKQSYAGHTLILEKNGIKHVIALSDILLIESVLRKTVINFADGTKEEFPYNMKDIEEIIDSPAFVRIHKSFIINLDHVSLIESARVLFTNGSEINVSRPYRKSLREKAAEYFGRGTLSETEVESAALSGVSGKRG